MKKIQKRAVESLALNIDELTDKPRRLFSSLVKFADAFVEDKEYKLEVIDTIHDFERRYYFFYTLSELSSDLLVNSNTIIRELTGEVAFNKSYHKDRERFIDYEEGVKDACKMMSEKMIKNIIEHIN